jgi:hypothetical protein
MSTAEDALRALFDCTAVVLGLYPGVLPHRKVGPEDNDMIRIDTIPNAAPEYHRDAVFAAQEFVVDHGEEMQRIAEMAIKEMVPPAAPAGVRKTRGLASLKALWQKCKKVVQRAQDREAW